LVVSLWHRLKSDAKQVAIEKMTSFLMDLARNKCQPAPLKPSLLDPCSSPSVAGAASLGASCASTNARAKNRDQYDRFIVRLDAMDRQILELELQGHSIREIAEKVERSQRTVRLRLEKIYYLFSIAADEK
jgi:DNA-binding NarL/FixJ family response regulator